MSIVASLKRVIEGEGSELFAAEPSYQELKKFYDAMHERGLVMKRDYGLADMDTIGRDVVTAEPLSMNCASKPE